MKNYTEYGPDYSYVRLIDTTTIIVHRVASIWGYTIWTAGRCVHGAYGQYLTREKAMHEAEARHKDLMNV